MIWRIQFTDPARKDLRNLDKTVAARVIQAFRRLESEMTQSGRPGSSDVKRLKGSSGLFRLRIGDYRAVFTQEKEWTGSGPEGIISVHSVRPRGGAYK